MIGCFCNNEAAKKRTISSTQGSDGNGDYIEVHRAATEKSLGNTPSLLDDHRPSSTPSAKCSCLENCSGQTIEKESIGIGDVDAHKFFQKQKTVKVLPSVSPIFCPGIKDDTSGNVSAKSPEIPDVPARKGNSKRKKKKRKLKALSICTTNCKYEVVRRVAARFGMREVSENFLWNLYWTDLSVSVERAKEMKRFQKINHFPGMNEICRKDLLARNLNRMLKIFPKDYNFFPMTWCLPSDHGEFSNYARPKRNKTYICKPDTGCQGRGIYVTRSYKDIKPYDRMICQVYLQKPFLIDGFKFDLRVYTLITSCDPLRIFVFNDGLARFATSPYKEPTVTNSSNVFMHLTNYAVNKHSRTYKVDEEVGSKRKISTLNRILMTKNVNVTELWSRIDDIIIKTVIAAHPTLKHSYNACFPSHDFTYACFELLGFDVLIDHKLKPFLLEVNHSPSFHTELQIDREIKESLLNDTFEILNLSQTDKKKIIEEDRRRVRERLLQGIIHKEIPTTEDGGDQNDPFKNQRLWEEKHMGNFRCIYPQEDSENYERFFNQNASSLFQDTAASRAREECSRIQRQEMQTKAAKEAAKRSGSKARDLDKLRPESASSRDGKKAKTISAPPKKKPLLPSRRIKGARKDSYLLNSFMPEKVDEEEEMERKSELAQRDFLIKSYNIIEQIYLGMMKNGTLRDTDRKKYGSLGRLQFLSNSSPTNPNKLPSIGASSATGDKQPAQSASIGIPPPTSYAVTELTPTCNNVPMLVRPAVPNTAWHNDQSRSTKADEARSFTNSVKLHGLEKREQRQLFNNA